MKKFVTAVAVVALVAFAAPVFAATNPFMDVPMNHWAYDAIGQLAAHGILSGYPDGTYKGKQPCTRYEMASALARALAVVDMTKASKQDVEMLQKLVVEFHDELEALGVRVDDIEGKVNLLDSRLGGWKLSGVMRLDIGNNSEPGALPAADGSVSLTRARIQFDRYFGDPENPMHFKAILKGDDGNGKDSGANWKHFYVEVPFFYDTLLTVGKANYNWESGYYYGGASVAGWDGLGALQMDRDMDMLMVSKQFGMGSVTAYVAHPDTWDSYTEYKTITDPNTKAKGVTQTKYAYSAWELVLAGKFQFNEQFGFDLAFQGFKGDNAEEPNPVTGATVKDSSLKFNDAYNIMVGLHYNFNDNVAFKGIYYHQKIDADRWLWDKGHTVQAWREPEDSNDSTKHWAVMLSVNQEALKFTSLWLEYGQVDKGYLAVHGLDDGKFYASTYLHENKFIQYDTKYYRIALAQQWNEKWSTHEFYYAYKLDDTPATQDDMSEWGLGVDYRYNPSVKFGLAFMQADNGKQNADKDNLVRFRTEITF